MKLLLVVAVLFFACAFAENYTSSWVANTNENVTVDLWNAEGSSRVWGSVGYFTFLKGRVKTNEEGEKYISGKFVGPGKRFGGVQLSQRNFLRIKGTFSIWFTEDGATLTYNYQGAGGSASVDLVQTETVCTSENYIVNCGVRAESSEGLTLDGSWMGTVNISICTESSEGTYVRADEFDIGGVTYAYETGQCTPDGTVCMFDWFRKGYLNEDLDPLWLFGGHMFMLLADGTNLWIGVGGYDNNPLILDFSWGASVFESSDSFGFECDKASDVEFNPLKCQQFDNELCSAESGYGLCQLDSTRAANSMGNNCFKVPYEFVAGRSGTETVSAPVVPGNN